MIFFKLFSTLNKKVNSQIYNKINIEIDLFSKLISKQRKFIRKKTQVNGLLFLRITISKQIDLS
jgi:hypothetical protein